MRGRRIGVRLAWVVLVLVAATACGGTYAPTPMVTIGGVIEVDYDTTSHVIQSRVERACRLELAPDPPSLDADEGWYRDPGGAERKTALDCLRKQRHVLRAALPL